MEVRYIFSEILSRYNVKAAPGTSPETFVNGIRDCFTMDVPELKMIFTPRSWTEKVPLSSIIRLRVKIVEIGQIKKDGERDWSFEKSIHANHDFTTPKMDNEKEWRIQHKSY
jgi:hypothetical protein